MTYQGERARPMASENGRFFEVSKVRIGPDGQVTDVLWCEVDPGADRAVGARVVAPASEVVDALHDGAQVAAVFTSGERCPERSFLIIEHDDGREGIAFEGPPSQGRNIDDIDSLDD